MINYAIEKYDFIWTIRDAHYYCRFDGKFSLYYSFDQYKCDYGGFYGLKSIQTHNKCKEIKLDIL